MGSYLPSTPEERQRLLAEIGVKDSLELYADVPETLRLESLNIPQGKSELEVVASLERLAEQNSIYKCTLRGAGAEAHYIPSIVQQVASKESFVTAYTPYQAEISQGVLQAIFEYQTLICRLTGMDVSNASLYDGATAAAEALHMTLSRRRKRLLVADTIHPMWRGTLETYYRYGQDAELVFLASTEGRIKAETLEVALGSDVAGVLVPQVNFYGQIEDCAELATLTKAAGAQFVMAVHPLAAGLLASAAECGADIACGEGQALGMPLSFGGPYLGFIACSSSLMRQLPGRIVGQTQDSEGRRAFVLTLQAREQHIRREKAGSNICTNQALCALTASAYLAAIGPEGLEQVARLCYEKAHYLAQGLAALPGFELLNKGPFFHEFVTRCSWPAEQIEALLAEQGIQAGLPLDEKTAARMGQRAFVAPFEGGMLWCVTELVTRAEIDRVLACLSNMTKGATK